MSREERSEGGYRPKRQKKSSWDVQEAPPPADPLILQQLQKSVAPSNIYGPGSGSRSAPQMPQASSQAAPGCRIYVGSIHYDLRESDIVALFSSFGPVIKSEMTMDPMTGRSKGFCFIEYADAETAQAAMAMDGFDLAGRRIKVGRPFHGQGGSMGQNGASLSLAMSMGLAMTNQTAAAPVNPLLSGLPMLSANKSSLTSSSGQLLLPSSIGSNSSSAVSGTTLNSILVKNVDVLIPINELNSIFEAFGEVVRCQYVEVGRLNNLPRDTKAAVVEFASVTIAQTTASAMDRFVLGGLELSVEVITLDKANQLLAVDDSTFCRVILKDMVTLEDAEDPDLKDEITEEANNYGKVLNVVIEVKHNKAIGKDEVIVELKYSNPTDSHKAMKALNGRAFGGKKINAVLSP